MMLARAELLQRRVTRSLQLLSSPHNNPDFPSPKPSPNDHVCKGVSVNFCLYGKILWDQVFNTGTFKTPATPYSRGHSGVSLSLGHTSLRIPMK